MSSICALGRSDPDIAAINDEAAKLLERPFERHVKVAKNAGEIAAELVPRDVARDLRPTRADRTSHPPDALEREELVGRIALAAPHCKAP